MNTYTTGYQSDSSVTVDPTGRFVVVWMSNFQDGDGGGVFGRRFDADGGRLGGEFRVNGETTDDQWGGHVATGPEGDFVVVWNSYGADNFYTGVLGRQFDAEGRPVGPEFLVNTQTSDDQLAADVATDPEGRFVVVWAYSYDGMGLDIFGQRYDAAGKPLGGEFEIGSLNGRSIHHSPDVAVDAAGDFVVVWQQNDPDGSDYDISARRYDASGNPKGFIFEVNTTTTDDQVSPVVSTDATGNFLVVWAGWDADGRGVFAQRYDAAGAPTGTEFQVNTYTPSHQLRPDVAADDTGNFIVVWSSSDQDGSDSGVFGQRFDNDGKRVGGEFQVNTYTTASQSRPSVAFAPGGDLVITWSSDGQDGSDWGVFGQRYAGLFADGFESGDTGAWNEVVED